MSKKTPDPSLREWAYPTCSVNGFGLLEQGSTYDLDLIPADLAQHPAWRAPAPTPTKESDHE